MKTARCHRLRPRTGGVEQPVRARNDRGATAVVPSGGEGSSSDSGCNRTIGAAAAGGPWPPLGRTAR
ncbi:MAG: hypothetical protein AVDCRST_MAG59-1924 [uncultured Thermomicrobiales bacterium]|uniref:Uncharacterized protein n=1 Tax=uncultured Thermomicrobiales bacterium TaxID=1645740 RepID=A0A6J4UPQ7_9BACT|nr:MAG: hypothetical protein AVDCRST_MAG59-1924 [uncultured Thermomicrobiales bacterium]